MKRDRKTIRKPYGDTIENRELFLYGRLMKKSEAVGYCKLHTCYLAASDVYEKKCKKKNCIHLERKGK